jgi:hypothetical protein
MRIEKTRPARESNKLGKTSYGRTRTQGTICNGNDSLINKDAYSTWKRKEKAKVKFTVEQATKTQRGRRDTALLFL